ncbi:TPA: hypothetical protein EYP44_00820 [Candidatus Bathyarchaeota archaeon]|nr:hypothetical protein [Candidatus Bathyarchaeota archaeon]
MPSRAGSGGRRATIRVVIDKRERRSGIPEILRGLGFIVDFRLLDVGDYVVSPECAVERKSAPDFIRSVFSGRIFDQARRLSSAFRFPLIVVEGDIEEAGRGVRSAVYWGALTSLAFKYGCATFFTAGERQTAELIYTLARKGDLGRPAGPLLRRAGRGKDLYKRQLSILCSIPEIGPKLADRLLRRFGSVKGVIMASEAELAAVRGLGRKKASAVVSVLRARYRPERGERQLRLSFKKK